MEEEEDHKEDKEDHTSSTSNSKSRRRIVELTRNSKSTKVKIVDRPTPVDRHRSTGLATGRLQ